MNKVKIDIVDRLRNAKDLNMRPGTADSDVNVFALPVEITYGDLELAIREIERLRHDLNTVVRFRDKSYQTLNTLNIDTTTAPKPWGSSYAMNPENWK